MSDKISRVQKYTPIGVDLCRWKPLRKVSDQAFRLWFGMYTGREAKTSVPGLWPGSIYVMSDVSGLVPSDADKAIHNLITHELVLWDVENSLVRFLKLPDTLDRAHTAPALIGWWNRFRTLPCCDLRDSHVPQLWEMIVAGVHNEKMDEVWRQTFGTVRIPQKLPRYMLTSSSDTGTAVQPSLFASPSPPPPTPQSFHSNKINHSGPSAIHGPMDEPRTGSGSGSGSGFPEEGDDGHPDPEPAEDPERDQHAPGRPYLQLVPEAPPPTGNRLAEEAQERALRERDEHIAELHRAHLEAASASGAPVFFPSPRPSNPHPKAMTDGPRKEDPTKP